MMGRKAVVIEYSDYDSYPLGGQLTFLKHLVAAKGPELALVGVTRGEDVVGRWSKKRIAGHVVPYYALASVPTTPRAKPFCPVRLRAYMQFRRHRRGILASGIGNVFTQSPEALMAVCGWGWQSLCHRLPGVENPLRHSRYRVARVIANAYDRRLANSLRHADRILASADEAAIKEFVAQGISDEVAERVVQFPTRVDTNVFSPGCQAKARKAIGLSAYERVIVVCGRIACHKGWRLVLQGFAHALGADREAVLVFVGEGEDRSMVTKEAEVLVPNATVLVTGRVPQSRVVSYLRAADVCAVGSVKEGWSLAMLESLACGGVLVSTRVSGADAMIVPGANGYVVCEREPVAYGKALLAALELGSPNTLSLTMAQRYASGRLGRDMAQIWPALR